jgi:hypothetical protein
MIKMKKEYFGRRAEERSRAGRTRNRRLKNKDFHRLCLGVRRWSTGVKWAEIAWEVKVLHGCSCQSLSELNEKHFSYSQ